MCDNGKCKKTITPTLTINIPPTTNNTILDVNFLPLSLLLLLFASCLGLESSFFSLSPFDLSGVGLSGLESFDFFGFSGSGSFGSSGPFGSSDSGPGSGSGFFGGITVT